MGDWVEAADGDLTAIHNRIDELGKEIVMHEADVKDMRDLDLIPMHHRIDDLGKAVERCGESISNLQDGPDRFRTAVESLWVGSRHRDDKLHRLTVQFNEKRQLMEQTMFDHGITPVGDGDSEVADGLDDDDDEFAAWADHLL